jgi:hypothetical protein
MSMTFDANGGQVGPGGQPDPKEEFQQELIDAVVNAHSVGGHMREVDALALLVILGMDRDEADELLADARLCACEQ